MATKTINTRIKNKVDNYDVWCNSSTTLLNGEIAIVRVQTGDTYTNPVTGKAEPVVELLMKVGDGESSFASLPWLSAKASDVYTWAKNATIEEVPVTINVGNTPTAGTISSWLESINDKATSNSSSLASVIDKVDVTKVSTAISAAVEALESSTTGTGNFVKAVSQSNGKVSVTMGTIDASDIPTLDASKIQVSEGLSLDTKLSNIDATLADLNVQQSGHTDAQINNMIDVKINNLDSILSGSGDYVTNVVQTDGIVTVTKGVLPEASTSTAGIVKLGTEGGAATYDTVSTLSAEVSALKDAVVGGVHFKGTVSEIPTSATVVINGSDYTAVSGDIVIFEGKEFIYKGTEWEELGDVTRIGNLETKLSSLDYTGGDAGTNKFVTKITQIDGQITAEYAQPASENITHNGTTVKATLEDHDSRIANVEGAMNGAGSLITEAINALDVEEPVNLGTVSTSFIATAKQVDGKIVVTKANLPTASDNAAGITKLGVTGGAATFDRAEAINSALDSRIVAVENKLDGVTNVNTSISNALDNLECIDPMASGNAVTFIDTISQVNGKISATKKTITAASTTNVGTVQLSNDLDSTSETKAATSKAVKAVNDKAITAQTRLSNVESNYVRFNTNDNKLYVGKDGLEEIIFDCGGAE